MLVEDCPGSFAAGDHKSDVARTRPSNPRRRADKPPKSKCRSFTGSPSKVANSTGSIADQVRPYPLVFVMANLAGGVTALGYGQRRLLDNWIASCAHSACCASRA